MMQYKKQILVIFLFLLSHNSVQLAMTQNDHEECRTASIIFLLCDKLSFKETGILHSNQDDYRTFLKKEKITYEKRIMTAEKFAQEIGDFIRNYEEFNLSKFNKKNDILRKASKIFIANSCYNTNRGSFLGAKPAEIALISVFRQLYPKELITFNELERTCNDSEYRTNFVSQSYAALHLQPQKFPHNDPSTAPKLVLSLIEKIRKNNTDNQIGYMYSEILE